MSLKFRIKNLLGKAHYFPNFIKAHIKQTFENFQIFINSEHLKVCKMKIVCYKKSKRENSHFPSFIKAHKEKIQSI